MAVGYKVPDLGPGVEAALKRIPSICRRDGVELLDAHVLVRKDGRRIALTVRDGEWFEVVEL